MTTPKAAAAAPVDDERFDVAFTVSITSRTIGDTGTFSGTLPGLSFRRTLALEDALLSVLKGNIAETQIKLGL